MKWVLGFLLLCSPLIAEEEEEDEFAGKTNIFPGLCDLPAFSFESNYTNVSQTVFYSPEVFEENLKYSEVDLNFSYLYPFNDRNAISFGAGFIWSDLQWNENPFFQESEFGYATFTLAYVSMLMEDWLLKAGEIILLDTGELSLSDYALYQTFLFGKYALALPLYLNMGFILELGLNKGKIWPVLGLDFYCSKKLQFHAVYPLDISCEYYVIPELSLEASCRFLRNRHRVKNTEPLPMGIFEYRTTGAEFNLNYKPSEIFLISGYIGKTFDGDLKITDRTNSNAIHEKFRGSLYYGLSSTLTF